MFTRAIKSALTRARFSLRALLLTTTALSLFFAFALTWEDPPTVGIMVASSIPFYAVLLTVAILVRKPLVCAITWIAIRAAVFVAFLIAGGMKGGDEGFVLFGWGLSPDLPILPLCEAIQRLLGDEVGAVVGFALYLTWYAGGGCLVGRWAQRSARIETKVAR